MEGIKIDCERNPGDCCVGVKKKSSAGSRASMSEEHVGL